MENGYGKEGLRVLAVVKELQPDLALGPEIIVVGRDSVSYVRLVPLDNLSGNLLLIPLVIGLLTYEKEFLSRSNDIVLNTQYLPRVDIPREVEMLCSRNNEISSHATPVRPNILTGAPRYCNS